jgi:hypothetical protein
MSKRSVEILKSILKKVENMPFEEKKKISDKLNAYVEELHSFDQNFLFDYSITNNLKYQDELLELEDYFYFAA